MQLRGVSARNSKRAGVGIPFPDLRQVRQARKDLP